MITTEKLKEYEQYHGYYDGFYLQKVKRGKNLNSDDDWLLIESLRGDIRLISNGIASENLMKEINERMRNSCDNDYTVEYLKELARKEW